METRTQSARGDQAEENTERVTTQYLVNAIANRRKQLTTERQTHQDAVKRIDAELASLPKLPGERKARKQRADKGVSRNGAEGK